MFRGDAQPHWFRPMGYGHCDAGKCTAAVLTGPTESFMWGIAQSCALVLARFLAGASPCLQEWMKRNDAETR